MWCVGLLCLFFHNGIGTQLMLQLFYRKLAALL
jgi:hypothetical protein